MDLKNELTSYGSLPSRVLEHPGKPEGEIQKVTAIGDWHGVDPTVLDSHDWLEGYEPPVFWRDQYMGLFCTTPGPAKVIGLPEGHIWVFLGDLIHKGAWSLEAVEMVMWLEELGHAISVRGNHDDTFGFKGKFLKDEVYLSKERHGEWLKNLPLFVRYNGILYLHGGINDTVAGFLRQFISQGLLPQEGDWTPSMVRKATGSLSKTKLAKLDIIMYVRWLRYGLSVSDQKKRAAGMDVSERWLPVDYGKNVETDTFWAELYDGEFGHVVFGHNPFPQIKRFPHATGIDLGAGTPDMRRLACLTHEEGVETRTVIWDVEDYWDGDWDKE